MGVWRNLIRIDHEMRKKFENNDFADWFYSSLVTTDDGTFTLMHTEERRVLRLLRNLEGVCTSLLQSRDVIYQCENGRALICNDVGEKLLEIMENGMTYRVESILPGCRLNPLVRVALSAIATEQIFACIRKFNFHKTPEKASAVVEVLNAVVDSIRKEGCGNDFKRIMKNYKRCVDNNRREVSSLVDGLFLRYSKVLVVRVDLAYKRASSDSSLPHEISHTDARRDLKMLLKDMRSKLFKTNYITYVWKLEYGPLKGYHYHAFFFFDGSRVRRDINLAEIIGDHWRTVVTAGRGCVFNCNKVKNYYPSLGIGMIGYTDSRRIDNLIKVALEYLMKVDYYVKAIADERIRTFGKGKLPGSPSNKGRPRGPSAIGLGSLLQDAL